MTSVATNPGQSPTMEQKPQRLSSAPLPSPSQTEQANYFEAMRVQSQHQQQAQQAFQQGFQQMAQQQQPNGAQHMGPQGGSPETASFLSNLNLVAEAAKRAQMACLMRDFGDVEL